jgi:hypothetical protein
MLPLLILSCFLHFGHQVAAYLNQCYENHWTGHHGPIPWPLKFPNIIPPDFFLWALMTYRTKVHTREELLHQIMNNAAYIQRHSEMIQWAVNSHLEQARLCIENCGAYFEQL